MAGLEPAIQFRFRWMGASPPMVRGVRLGYALFSPAGVAELVDATDLKSVGAKALCRFESGRPHQMLLTS